ncbi:hypothetical protein [Nocardia testacea]|uniref:hypothetical protein n=1 Tax=Nocardia testacea TaxID=248551 RepID=UPI0033C88761
MRKPAPKSDNGWRRVLLPEHTVEAFREACKDLETTACPQPAGPAVPGAQRLAA